MFSVTTWEHASRSSRPIGTDDALGVTVTEMYVFATFLKDEIIKLAPFAEHLHHNLGLKIKRPFQS